LPVMARERLDGDREVVRHRGLEPRHGGGAVSSPYRKLRETQQELPVGRRARGRFVLALGVLKEARGLQLAAGPRPLPEGAASSLAKGSRRATETDRNAFVGRAAGSLARSGRFGSSAPPGAGASASGSVTLTLGWRASGARRAGLRPRASR